MGVRQGQGKKNDSFDPQIENFRPPPPHLHWPLFRVWPLFRFLPPPPPPLLTTDPYSGLTLIPGSTLVWLENFASVSEYAGVVWSGARFRGCSFSRVHRHKEGLVWRDCSNRQWGSWASCCFHSWAAWIPASRRSANVAESMSCWLAALQQRSRFESRFSTIGRLYSNSDKTASVSHFHFVKLYIWRRNHLAVNTRRACVFF